MYDSNSSCVNIFVYLATPEIKPWNFQFHVLLIYCIWTCFVACNSSNLKRLETNDLMLMSQIRHRSMRLSLTVVSLSTQPCILCYRPRIQKTQLCPIFSLSISGFQCCYLFVLCPFLYNNRARTNENLRFHCVLYKNYCIQKWNVYWWTNKKNNCKLMQNQPHLLRRYTWLF